MEAAIRSVQKQVESLKQEIAEMKAAVEGLGTAEPVFELREVSYEDAKREIKQYFEAHHEESIDAADLQEALGIDIQMAIQILPRLRTRRTDQGAMTTPEPKPCLRDLGDCIEGDSIYVECRKKGKWKLFRMSGQDKGVKCTAKKNAKAIILREYTNIKSG